LAAMQHHRPAVYKILADAEPGDRYQLLDSKAGPTTIAYRADNGGLTIMSGDSDPLGSVKKVMTTIDDAWRAGKTLGIASIGDGYLIRELADCPPKLILGREQPVCIFEPDARLVLACLMIHDYTGPDGPIEQGRFQWYIG